jgi:hypothetical protein
MTAGVRSGWIGHCIGFLMLNRHTMEVEQMMACLLGKIKTNQEHLKEAIKANKAERDTKLREKHLKEEMLDKLDVHHKRMAARMDSQLQKMDACLGKMEATDLEANPERKKSVAVHEKVLKEEVALKKQHGNWHLAIGPSEKLKEWTQGDGGSWKKLAVTCRRMTRHAIPTWREGHGYHGQGQVKCL